MSKLTRAAVTNQPLFVTSEMPILKAAKTMSRFGIGSLLVQHSREDSEVIGLITERDVTERVKVHGGYTRNHLVRDAMSPDDFYCSEQWKLERCLQILFDANVRHVPIVGMGGVVNALLSVPDVCRAITADVIQGVKPAEPHTLADVLHPPQRDKHAIDLPPMLPFISQVAGAVPTVSDAVARMCEDGRGSVVVCAESSGSREPLLGLFTERDLVRHLGQSGASPPDSWMQTPISEHMTPAPELIWLDASVGAFDALSLLAQRGGSHLLVGGGPGEPCQGVVSMFALLRHVIDNA